ncbi:MAG: NAD(P)/FAD-dependent oxidoreductase [Candidatus Helarchaeota archaeon]
MTKYIIVGNGVSGINAASVIRREDPDGIIEIFTDEHYLTYARPKLPGYIADIVEFNDLFIKKEDYYKENRINLHLSSKVIDIHINNKEIELENGQKIKYDKLLLAAGSHAFIPPIKGTDKKKVMTIRTLDDSNMLMEIMKTSEKVIIIGGGLLGIETANSIRSHGHDVLIIEYFPRLLPRQLDTEGAKILQTILEKKGIKIILGVITERIIGNDMVRGVKLKDGREFPADCVVISAGIHPNIHLAEKCDITCNRGIIVNEFMETNFQDIYAAGDIAEFNNKVWGIIPVAFAQSKIAAINMVHGNIQKYKEIIPSNTLKVIDVNLTSIGTIYFEKLPPNIIEKRVSNANKGIYKKIVLEQENNSVFLIGAILLGDKSNSIKIQKLIKEKINVKDFSDKILDSNINLDQYMK